MRYRWTGIGASLILGIIFIFSGVGKLLRPSDAALTDSLVNPTLARGVTYILPWVELVLAVLLIGGTLVKPAAGFSLALIVAFIANNGWLIARGLAHETCGCFGIFEQIFLVRLSALQALFLDIAMAGLVISVFFCYPGGFLTTRPWFLRRVK